ncbi:MAG TPA: hypothetical protein VGN63_02045 [Flavisolibacter sp.]|jgi:hypothetical protein|nr:hypothetical protein [Flavisolibacter sp.]
MIKRICLLVYIFCFSCSNETSNSATENASTSAAPGGVTQALSKESELEILAGCVDNAKTTLGDTRAYALCKCVLGQVQEKHPQADSAALIRYLSDTTEVAAMARNCK